MSNCTQSERSESVHTPGPWELKKGTYGPMVTKGEQLIACGMNSTSGVSEEEQANAELIAQAPRLLEALKELTHHARVVIAKRQATNGLSEAAMNASDLLKEVRNG